MKNKLILLGSAIAFVIIIILLSRGSDEDSQFVVERPVLPEPFATMNLSGAQTGLATLTEIDGVVEAQYGFIDAPQGIVQPSHIHAGTCAALGDIKHLLEFPVDGISLTWLEVSRADLQAQLPLAIATHKSLEEMGEYVACGDMTLK